MNWIAWIFAKQQEEICSLWSFGKESNATLGILPPGDVSTMQADTTFTTSAAGLPKDFNSPKLALSKLFNAASASLMIGSVTSKSRLHSSWKAVTSSYGRQQKYIMWIRNNLDCILNVY